MKYWLIAPEYPLGGAERQMFELAKSNKDSFQLIDLKSADKNRIIDGVNIIGLGTDVLHLNTKNKVIRRFKRYFSFYSLLIKLKKERAGTVVFYNPIFFLLAYFLKKNTDIKVVFSMREYKPSLFKFLNLYILKKIDLIYTNTPRVKAKLNELGVNCDLILNTINVENTQQTLTRNKNEIFVVSNLEPHKAIHILLYATQNMSLTINIAGRLSNPDYYNYCQSIAKTSSCTINFLGAIPQESLRAYLIKSSCLVHPSILEGTSNAILDAIGTSTPLLVSDIPENSYLVDDLDCFTFRANNTEELKLKLSTLLKNSEETETLNKLELLRARLNIKFSTNNLAQITRLLNDD